MVNNLTYTHLASEEDDVEKYIEFTEVETSPNQSQYRVDYPPEDGEGTGLVEFNQNDASKEIRVNYKATGSPALEEFLDTKVSYPAGDPVDHQILGFVSGAPEWRYNPIRYFHEGQVIYNSAGENESCLLFRFKKTANEGKVYLELKGAKLHQGYYSELAQHNHGAGTLAGSQPTHQHGVGTLTNAAAPDHNHAKGTLAGSQPTHQHGVGTLAAANSASHAHAKGTLDATTPAHDHGFTGTSASGSNHSHIINNISHSHPSEVDTGGNQTGNANGCSSPTATEGAHTHGKGTFAVGSRSLTITVSGSTAAGGVHAHTLSGLVAAGGGDAVTIAGNTANGGGHNHVISGSVAAGGNDAVTISGSVANAGVAAKTYPNQLKIYVNGINKTTEILALTGLTQFGDGTAGHAFVTTGSGEMDVTSLVAAAQIHEIKVTEPIASAGGRCLLHLELV